MKIAILVMATKNNPSTRNVEAFNNTVVDYYIHNKDSFVNDFFFIFYYAGEKYEIKNENDTVYHISYDIDESVYRTFEKTVLALKDVKNIIKPDLYIRTNISTYINIKLIDLLANDVLKSGKLYCNKINNHHNIASPYFNDVYPRGDFMMFNEHVTECVIVSGEKHMFSNTNLNYIDIGVDHVDDCLIGVCMKDYMGDEYYKCIDTLKYNYIPQQKPDYTHLDTYAIATRLKTVPDGECSGYSWDDNNYRVFDVDKFYDVHENVKDICYNNLTLEMCIVPKRYQVTSCQFIILSESDYEIYKKAVK